MSSQIPVGVVNTNYNPYSRIPSARYTMPVYLKRNLKSGSRSSKRSRAVVVAAAVPRTRLTKFTPSYVSVGHQPFPPLLKNTLKYTEMVTVTLTAGAGTYVFTCNGVYDPNVTGTGTQPLYFDQTSAVYDHYTVVASRAKFQLNDSSNKATTICLFTDDDATTTGNAIVGASRPGAVSWSGNPSVQPVKPLYKSWSAYKAFGPNVTSQTQLQGSPSANPTELQCFIFQINDVAGTSYNVGVYVEIEYDCIWNEISTIAVS